VRGSEFVSDYQTPPRAFASPFQKPCTDTLFTNFYLTQNEGIACFPRGAVGKKTLWSFGSVCTKRIPTVATSYQLIPRWAKPTNSYL
jgi:hypothetical protein